MLIHSFSRVALVATIRAPDYQKWASAAMVFHLALFPVPRATDIVAAHKYSRNQRPYCEVDVQLPGVNRLAAEGAGFPAHTFEQHLFQTGLAGTMSTGHGHRLIHQLLAVKKLANVS